MEREGSHGYQSLQKSNYYSGGMTVTETNRNHFDSSIHQNKTSSNQLQWEEGQERGESSCTVREQSRYMPIANVTRTMRKVLPIHAKISDDAKETIQECVSEYINFITSEANDHCQREQRKTITADDVMWAIRKLGFDDYIHPLTLYLQRYRAVEGDRGSIRGDLPMKRSGATYVPAAFHIGHHQGLFGGVGAAPLGGYFRDISAAGSSHAAMAILDLYSSYKRM